MYSLVGVDGIYVGVMAEILIPFDSVCQAQSGPVLRASRFAGSTSRWTLTNRERAFQVR